MKTKILGFMSTVMLIYTVLNGVYVALPQEYKEMIPYYNDITALITGGTTGLLGGVGLYFQTSMAKLKVDNTEQYVKIATEVLNVKTFLNDFKEELIEQVTTKVIAKIEDNNKLQLHNNKLLIADVSAKLSNPLIEETVKDLIQQAINENEVATHEQQTI